MKGTPKVIEQLNHALREELTAINQYFVHAEMCENWGYDRLSKFIKKQSIDEMKHAESLMERIFFLDGTPNMEPLALTIGKDVKGMIESDLKLELGAIAMYNEAARIATEEKDHGTRDLFIKLLKDEEEHADWLETQLHQIAEIGYERYLTTQTSKGE
jgi:bacterioferritin